MKRLALIIVLGVVAVQWIHHSERRAHVRSQNTVVITPNNSRVEFSNEVDSRIVRVQFSADPVAPQPPEPPRAPEPPKPPRRGKKASRSVLAPVAPVVSHEAVGRLSATEDRAKADALRQLKEDVTKWLDRDVPSAWANLDSEVGKLLVETRVVPLERDYATVYKATIEANFSSERRAAIIARYQHEIVMTRLFKLGSGVGFTLVCLASLAGYIKADEATKGYYTKRLRVVSAAGVGAAGVALYHALV